MAGDAPAINEARFISLRMMEWSVALALILALVVVFMYQVRAVQRQAELAAVRTTLGALRTALVLHHLQQQAQGQNVAILQRNPFELLKRPPANYAGVKVADQTADLAPGNWIFDAQCVCIAYLPNDASEFDSPSGDAMAWYLVEGSPTSPLQINPKEPYKWQGELMN